jgi:polar amino acid transport system permease protein
MKFLFRPEWLPRLAKGLGLSLEVTAICIVIGIALGLLLALGRLYGRRWLSWPCRIYIEFFRATPLLVQLLMVYYAFPAWGIRLSPFASGILAFGLNTAAYQAEYFRGAIQAVKAGQTLAACSLGMTLPQTIRHVLLPQALRIVIPPWSNELILMLKYSSILYMVTLPDIMGEAKKIATKYANSFDVYLVVALFYLALVLIISWLLRLLEKRIKIPGLGTSGERR